MSALGTRNYSRRQNQKLLNKAALTNREYVAKRAIIWFFIKWTVGLFISSAIFSALIFLCVWCVEYTTQWRGYSGILGSEIFVFSFPLLFLMWRIRHWHRRRAIRVTQKNRLSLLRSYLLDAKQNGRYYHV